MPLTDKQKTYVNIAIVTVMVLFVAPRIIGVYEQHKAAQKAAFAAAHTKPSPAVPLKNTAPSGVPAPAAPAPIPLVITMGKYQGAGLSNTRQCKIDLELRPGQGDAYTGYVTMMCFEPPHVTGGKPPKVNPLLAAMAQMTPANAVLTGTVKNGDIVFNVDKALGKFGDGCPLTGTFTVSTFGAGQIIAQWQEGECTGGQLILHHI
jgi:hypothetical protein